MKTQAAENFDDDDSSPRPAGRPRSESSRSAILDATRRLMTHMSVRDMSIESIAKKAGVGKTTIYRWWPNKVAVVIDAFAEQLDMHMLTAGNESPAENLVRQIDRMVRQLRGKNGKIIAEILSESQSDPRVLEQFHHFYMNSRRTALRQTIADGQKNGDFNAEIDSDMAVDIVLGPVILRLLSKAEGLDDIFAAHYPSIAVYSIRA